MGRIDVKKRHTFLGHSDSLYTLEAISESRFVSAGGDGMVIEWDLEEPGGGEVVAKVNGSVFSLAYEPEKGLLLVGENNEGLHLLDKASKKEISSIALGNYQIFDVKFYQNTIWVALSSGELLILDQNLNLLKRIRYSTERMRHISFFNNQAALSFSDHLVRVIDIQTLEVITELKGHSQSVFSASYHPSGKYLITTSRDAQIKVWDARERYVLRESIPAHLYSINHLVFNKNGKYFVTGSMDKSVKLWDAYTFKLLKVLDKQRHAGHGNSVNKLLWMDYRDLLVTCSDDRSVSVWELKIEE